MRSGQVAVYLLITLVALILLSLLNVDIYTLTRGKMRAENAGDAAALAAAHYQGELLNKIGRLNLEHLISAIRNEREKCDEIVQSQRELTLLGPVEALKKADEAARKNGAKVRPQFSDILRRHVQDIRTIYAGGSQNEADPFPESWPGAWMDYAFAIEQAISRGLATGPDNIEFYYYSSGHPLLDKEFYYAVAGSNWCWFKFNAPNLLYTYLNYSSWPPLPVSGDKNTFENSEIFSLHLDARKCSILDFFKKEEILELLESQDIKNGFVMPFTIEDLDNSYILTNKTETWFFYNKNSWGTWSEMNPFTGVDGYAPMPVIGQVRPEYDVRGAAAICRCVNDVESVAVENSSSLNWTAAAKPFGVISDSKGSHKVTFRNDFVIPSFNAVRLVPIDSVGGRNLATADYEWVVHIREHLGLYLVKGPRSGSCFYCSVLRTWERPSFRLKGANWLRFNSHTCRRPTGGGGSSGGTQHAH